MHIPEQVRNELKKPLGSLHTDFKEIKELSLTHRIISVGDVCTLGLLAMGIRPHLAVFDHLFMRRRLEPGMIRILESHFKNPKKYKNSPGTLSKSILSDAAKLLEEGGAVLIDGEEDLTALAFIMAAGTRDVIVYGQPDEGMVVVKPNKALKKKVKGWLQLSRES
jgi:hypothetical protein